MTIERTDPVNWSTLRYMRTSPKHYLHALAHPREDTDALLRGRALHCCVYEPETFTQRYAVLPNFHGSMLDENAIAKGYQGGKQAKADWIARHASAEIIDAEMFSAVQGMNAALKADPIAAGLIVGGKAEVPIEWTDAETGIQCRGRVDHINGILSDLKSTRNIDTRLFARDAASFGYHAQLAYYSDGLAASGVVLHGSPVLIVVENVPPYDVAVLELDQDALDAGRSVYRACLARLLECRATGHWPGVSVGRVAQLSLPAWALPEDEPITVGGERLL